MSNEKIKNNYPDLLDSTAFVDEKGSINALGWLFLSCCFNCITSCILKTVFSKSSF